MASPASLRHLARGRTRRGQRESLGLARVAPGPGASQAEEAHIRGCQGALGLDTEAVFTGWSSPVRSRGTGRGAGDGAAMHGLGRVARITDGEQPTLLLEGDGGGGRPFPAGLAPVGAPSVGTLGDEHSPLRVGELDGAGLATESRSYTGGNEESAERRGAPLIGTGGNTCDVYILIEELQQGQAGVVHVPQVSARAIWRKQPRVHRKESHASSTALADHGFQAFGAAARGDAEFPRRSLIYASKFALRATTGALPAVRGDHRAGAVGRPRTDVVAVPVG